MHHPDRRRFLKTTALGASAAFFGSKGFAGFNRRVPTPADEGKPIIKRVLGKTGIELPVVSMGVMRSDNKVLVRAALKEGLIHLDTAHGYQKGKNETMLGEVLESYPRDSFVIATKVPAMSKSSFLEKLDISLERLKMKYVDILYVHGLSSRDDVLGEETLETLADVRKSGKVRHVGLSTHKNETETILAAVESGVYEVVLTAYNFKQDHLEELKKAIATAAKSGIGIVGMKSMAGGFFDKEGTRPINCKAALKWVLQDEHVTTTIPGITTYEHLVENASVNQDITLTAQEEADLALGKDESGLYCQGCERCVRTCSRHLPIPDIMRCYMYTYGYRNPAEGRAVLDALGVSVNPCVSCEVCTAHCAKGFQVRQRVADVSRLVDVPEEFFA